MPDMTVPKEAWGDRMKSLIRVVKPTEVSERLHVLPVITVFVIDQSMDI